MSAPEQQATDPRKPAWDAVFAYIRTLPREGDRPDVVERNAMIWRGVNAALVALGYPGEYEQAAPVQQAAPEQPDLHQRIAQALAAEDTNWGYDHGFDAITRDNETQAFVSAVLAALQPELAELAALRAQLTAAQTERTVAVAGAKAAGYRLAADNAAEQHQTHGADADAEMLVHFLQRTAELHQQFAADHPEQYVAARPTT